MKTGRVPIHIMRWSPSDYVNDPFVRRLYQRKNYRAAAFYPAFLFWCHMEGGHLPSAIDDLAAIVLMPPADVRVALKACIDAGRIQEKDGRLSNKRVTAELERELAFRAGQSGSGKKGAQARIDKVAEASPGVAQGLPKPVAGSGGDEALAGRGEAAGSPPDSPAIDQKAVGEIEAAQAECLVELRATEAALGRPQDELIWEASCTDRGRRIGRIDTCDSPKWLRTTAQKLREMRIGARVQAQGRASPPRKQTAAETNAETLRRAREKQEAMNGGPGDVHAGADGDRRPALPGGTGGEV